MSKAIYSTNNIGHYGLSFDYYTHFTSPIRRYPDIIAHRLLQHYLDRKKSTDKNQIEEKMKHCTVKEILATKAERQSIKFMQVVYISKEIGNIFKGVISGVVERGIYVEINKNKCEGMVNIRNFPKGYFLYNESNYSFEDEQQKLHAINEKEQTNVNLNLNSSQIKILRTGRLWIGPKGSQTPLHKDVPFNLSLQIYGRKEWLFNNF